jgi:hypothetical protein
MASGQGISAGENSGKLPRASSTVGLIWPWGGSIGRGGLSLGGKGSFLLVDLTASLHWTELGRDPCTHPTASLSWTEHGGDPHGHPTASLHWSSP